MRIAVIGCGAMGALYGGYLSRNNDVTLDGKKPRPHRRNSGGRSAHRRADGSAAVYRPGITGDTSGVVRSIW